MTTLGFLVGVRIPLVTAARGACPLPGLTLTLLAAFLAGWAVGVSAFVTATVSGALVLAGAVKAEIPPGVIPGSGIRRGRRGGGAGPPERFGCGFAHEEVDWRWGLGGMRRSLARECARLLVSKERVHAPRAVIGREPITGKTEVLGSGEGAVKYRGVSGR